MWYRANIKTAHMGQKMRSNKYTKYIFLIDHAVCFMIGFDRRDDEDPET